MCFTLVSSKYNEEVNKSNKTILDKGPEMVLYNILGNDNCLIMYSPLPPTNCNMPLSVLPTEVEAVRSTSAYVQSHSHSFCSNISDFSMKCFSGDHCTKHGAPELLPYNNSLDFIQSRRTLNVDIRCIGNGWCHNWSPLFWLCCCQCSTGTCCHPHIKAGAILCLHNLQKTQLKTLINAPIMFLCDSN